MAPRIKIVEGEGERFELTWQFESSHTVGYWVKDTKHGGGIRTLKLMGSPEPESMNFVKDINELATQERVQRTRANFNKRLADAAVKALEEVLPHLDKTSKAAAQVAEALAAINGMDYTDEDRK